MHGTGEDLQFLFETVSNEANIQRNMRKIIYATTQ
jgi:hypothetical protein